MRGLNLIEEYRPPARPWKAALAAFLLGVIVGGSAMYAWGPTRHRDRVEAVPDPSPGAPVDVVVIEDHTGSLCGETPLEGQPGTGNNTPGGSFVDSTPTSFVDSTPTSFVDSTPTSGVDSGGVEIGSPPVTLHAEVPVNGEVEVAWINESTGEELARGTFPVAGVTTVDLDGYRLRVDTVFTQEIRVGFRMPCDDAGLNHLGIGYVYPGGPVVYYRRDVPLISVFGVDCLAWGALAWTGDSLGAGVGIEAQF